jgi:electron transport complex protein RnfG
MILVLALITLASGLSLGALNEATYQLAADNVLRFKKIPAVVDIYAAAGNPVGPQERPALEEELLREKRLVDIGAKDSLLCFVVKDGGEPAAVALEGTGQGFGGDVGVMVGVGLDSGDLVGIGVTTMSETPGVGTRVREPSFARQFAGMSGGAVFKVKKDGGAVDAITGATISSRAVAAAVDAAVTTYREHRDAIRRAVEAGPAGASRSADAGGVS